MNARFISAKRHRHSQRIILAGAFLLFFCSVIIASTVVLWNGAATATVVQEDHQTKKIPTLEMAEVIVPIRQIESGEPLSPDLFRKEIRPKLGLLTATLHSLEEVHGMYAKSILPRDTPIIPEQLTFDRIVNSIRQEIPPGFRAVTISVNARTAVEGWAQANARVDVHWLTTVRGTPAATLLCENAKVLSAERLTNGEGGPDTPIPSTVTLLVSSEDASKILLAQNSGSLSLDLRGDGDMASGGSGSTITLSDILEGAKKDERTPATNIVTIRESDGSYSRYAYTSKGLKPIE